MTSTAFQQQRRALLFGGAALAAVPLALLGSEPRAAVVRPHRLLAQGLRFPEGPVARSDGSLLLVETARGTLTHIDPTGRPEVIAQLRGGPNGAAIGPDGACYVCNNGGDNFAELDGVLLPVGKRDDYTGGWIERVDLRTGQAETLYEAVGGHRLSAPNDLVFDATGGFWFTDIGKSDDRAQDKGGIYYARADGSAVMEAAYPVHSPNGIGLSPDGSTLVVAELFTGRLIAFDVAGPGKLSASGGILPGRFIAAGPGRYIFDSLALEANGNICVAAPLPGEIVCIAPNGQIIETVAVPGPLPTNICFGGTDRQTAYITLSGNGQVITMEWPRAGLPLA